MIAAAGLSEDAATAAEDVRALVAQYRDEIHAAARSMSRGAADAEDLAHDVIVRALRFADQFTPGTNFGAWVRTILRNTAINRSRRAKLEPRTAATESAATLIDDAPARPPASPHEGAGALVLDREALSDPLLRAIDDLPASFRDVLFLWAVGDYKYREIADTLGVPIGTVMSRLHRARAMLRGQLEDEVDARGVLVR